MFRKHLLSMGAILTFTVLGLWARLGDFARPFWLDESFHNLYVLKAHDLAELKANTTFLYTPLLDLILRWKIFYPILGISEFGARFPALMWSTVTLIVSPLVAWQFLKSKVSNSWLFVFVTVVAGWVAANHTEIHYASEARHYSFVSLASVLWFSFFVLARRQKYWAYAFTLISLIAINSHFFALSFVAAGFAYEILISIKCKNTRRAFGLAVAGALIFSATIFFNIDGLRGLLSESAVRSDKIPELSLVIKGTFNLWLRVWKYFHFIGFSAIYWIILCLAAFKTESPDKRAPYFRWLFLAFMVMPVLLVKMRMHASGEIWDRYLMPLFGLGLVTLILGLKNLSIVFERRMVIPLLIVAFIIFHSGREILGRQGSFHLPRGNFTETSKTFKKLKDLGRPMFVIASPCWGGTVPEIFWEHFLVSAPIDAAGGPTSPLSHPGDMPEESCINPKFDAGPLVNDLSRFLKLNPDSIVLLFGAQKQCPAVSSHAPSTQILTDGNGCMIVIEHASSVNQIANVAKIENFEAISIGR